MHHRYQERSKHKFERKGPKNSFWGSNWIRKFLYGVFFCRHKNVQTFTLCNFPAILHDAAGSVKSTTHKGPGYCYVLPRFPSFCFLGQVTGLLFCLYIKTFASSVYALFSC